MASSNAVSKSRRALEQVPLPAKDRKRHSISGEPHVYLEVHATGTRKFYFIKRVKSRKTDQHGRSRYDTKREFLGRLGDVPLPEVWKMAAEFRHKTAQGITIGKNARSDDNPKATFLDLVEEWRAKRAAHMSNKATVADYEQALKTDILPALAGLLAAGVRKRDVVRVIDKTAERSTHRADRARRVVSLIYNWAIQRDWNGLEINPAHNIASVHQKTEKHRALDDDELRLLWRAVGEPSIYKRVPARKHIIRLLALTGQRLNEVVEIQTKELSFEGEACHWHLPKSRAKNGVEMMLPFGPYTSRLWQEAVEIYSDNGCVFPPARGDGRQKFQNTDTISDTLETLRKTYGLDVTLHSLRYTARTRLAALRVRTEVSKPMLNHSDRKPGDVHDSIYNAWDFIDEKRDAFIKLEKHILAIVGD